MCAFCLYVHACARLPEWSNVSPFAILHGYPLAFDCKTMSFSLSHKLPSNFTHVCVCCNTRKIHALSCQISAYRHIVVYVWCDARARVQVVYLPIYLHTNLHACITHMHACIYMRMQAREALETLFGVGSKVYMYAYIGVCMDAYMGHRMDMYMMYVCMYVCMHVCMHVCVICMYDLYDLYICMCV